MRIWDVHPGYLNRQSLLGEHRELHGIVSIHTHGKKGYANHPETVRWRGYGWALSMRHRLLAAEMAIRGYTDRTPVSSDEGEGMWPDTWVDPPARQLAILGEKYAGREPGRIPLPERPDQLWAQHKYSVMARDVSLYRKMGPRVAAGDIGWDELVERLVLALRSRPTPGAMRNAIQHMWGHVSDGRVAGDFSPDGVALTDLLAETVRRAVALRERYLLASTAVTDLAAWLSVS